MTTDPPLLIGARLKIQNAHQHIGRLRATTEKMFERAIAEIAPETDATGNTVLSVRTSCEMLPGIPLALGDAVHNLRSSLDYAVSEICFVSSGSQGWSNRVEFPFHGTEKDLKTKVEGLKKEGMPNDIARYILEEVKPWKEQSTNPGNFVLWAMKQLDNDDKHKLLIPVGAVTSLKKVSFVANGPNVRNFLCQDNTIVAGPNGKFPVIGFGGGATISFENFGLPNWELLFAGDQYFPGRPVIPTLEIFAQLTSNVVEVLMRLFNERMSAGQEITQD